MANTLQFPRCWTALTKRNETSWPASEYDSRQWSGIRDLQTPKWLKEAFDCINGVAELRRNWDSYDAAAVHPHAVTITRIMLSNLELDDVPKPQICASPEGGVGLHWRVGTRDLELEVEPEGRIRFLKTALSDRPQMDDGYAEDFAVVQKLLSWIVTHDGESELCAGR